MPNPRMNSEDLSSLIIKTAGETLRFLALQELASFNPLPQVEVAIAGTGSYRDRYKETKKIDGLIVKKDASDMHHEDIYWILTPKGLLKINGSCTTQECDNPLPTSAFHLQCYLPERFYVDGFVDISHYIFSAIKQEKERRAKSQK